MSDEQKDKSGLETIVPELKEVTIGEVKVKVRRIKFRETIALWRVISSAGKRMPLDKMASSPEAMVSMIVLAIPNAEREFLDFLKSILEIPEGDTRKKVFKHIDENLENAEVLDVVEAIVIQEQDSWKELGKKLSHMGQIIGKTFKNK